MIKRINLIAKTVRNIGLLLGIPVVVFFAVQYHLSMIQKYDVELRLLTRHIELEKTKTSIAEKMSYPNVELLITSQKKIYEKEVTLIKRKILEQEKNIARLKKESEKWKQTSLDAFLEQLAADLKERKEERDKLIEKADKLDALIIRSEELNGKKVCKNLLREIYLIKREMIILFTEGALNGWPIDFIVDGEDKSKHFVLPSIQPGQSIDDAVMNAWSLYCGSKDFANEEECKENAQQGASH